MGRLVFRGFKSLILYQKRKRQRRIRIRRYRFSAAVRLQKTKNPGIFSIPGFCLLGWDENRAVSQKREFSCRARQKAQEYSERLPSMASDARREKDPFEAVYPYADALKKPLFLLADDCRLEKIKIIVKYRNRDTLLPFWVYSFLHVKSSYITQPSPKVSLSMQPFSCDSRAEILHYCIIVNRTILLYYFAFL